jgi:hypothetical protein
MHNQCPSCKADMGDLEELQDRLHVDLSNEVRFLSDCCNTEFRAFEKNGQYFIAADGDETAIRQMIGAR